MLEREAVQQTLTLDANHWGAGLPSDILIDQHDKILGRSNIIVHIHVGPIRLEEHGVILLVLGILHLDQAFSVVYLGELNFVLIFFGQIIRIIKIHNAAELHWLDGEIVGTHVNKTRGRGQRIRLKWLDRLERDFVFLNLLFGLEEQMARLGFGLEVALVERIGLEFNFACGDDIDLHGFHGFNFVWIIGE